MVQKLFRTPSVLMTLAALCWGLASAISKVALGGLAPYDLFAIEVGTGALVLGVVAAAHAGATLRALTRPAFLALGILEPGLGFLLYDVGLDHTAATHAALLLASESVFTVLLAALVLRERLGPALAFAIAAGVSGTALVSLHAGGAAASVGGDAFVVAASLSAAGYAVLARRLAPEGDPLVVTAAQLLGGALIAAPALVIAALSGMSELGMADARHLLAALATGLLASVVPFLLYNAAAGRITASGAAVLSGMVPLFGAVAATALLGEALGPAQIAGGMLILVATAAAVRRHEAEAPVA